jgi:hypothetical protein
VIKVLKHFFLIQLTVEHTPESTNNNNLSKRPPACNVTDVEDKPKVDTKSPVERKILREEKKTDQREREPEEDVGKKERLFKRKVRLLYTDVGRQTVVELDGRAVSVLCVRSRKPRNIGRSGWVTKNLLFRAHVKPLVPGVFAVVSIHQSALGPRGGLWPVLLMFNS